MPRRKLKIIIAMLFASTPLPLFLLTRQALVDEGLIHWTDSRIEDSIAIGNDIVFALNEHKQEHTTYPASLDELPGKHIGRIYNPVAGTKQWHYEVHEGEFTLSFGSGRHHCPCVYYQSPHHNWRHDQ